MISARACSATASGEYAGTRETARPSALAYSACAVSVSAVAINWAMSKGAVVIVGMKTPEQVRENLGALGWRISGAESDELERAARLAKTATQNIFQTD